MVIVVEIEDRCVAKPFLGGWRNVVTETEYHDACTQTCPRDNVVYSGGGGGDEKNRKDHLEISPFVPAARNVITKKTCEKSVGTDASVLMAVLEPSRCKYTSIPNDRATQTSHLPDLRDKFLTPLARRDEPTGRISQHVNRVGFSDVTSLSLDALRSEWTNRPINGNLEDEAAAKIQRCYRAYRARVEFGALARLSRATRAQTPPQPEKVYRFRHCRASEFEIVNLRPPSKRSDFEMVDNVLERWRFYENARVDAGFFGTSKLAARALILQREIELLRSVEAIKMRVRGERKKRMCLANLDKLAEPEVWTVANGEKKIFVDTLRVQRARECRDFYRSLVDENLTFDDRKEILKKLRNYAAQHTCQKGEDLCSLVDQELELSAINGDENLLKPLRNRLMQALLRLTMNFSVGRGEGSRAFGEKAKESFSKLCKRCSKFLTIDDLTNHAISANSDLLATCENCRRIQPGKDSKIVSEPYDIMLRDLRNREADLGLPAESGSPAWIVDSKIIYRLVNYIWHGKSGISECDDLYRLYLIRFRSECPWSPWNNLVLTKREAALHRSMDDPWQIYAPIIMKKFVVKNLQAKLRFDFKTRANFF